MKPALTVRQAPTSDGARFFQSASGAPIAQIPLEAFPDFWAYAYLVLTNDFCVLIDTGSGFGDNNAHLQAGFEQASAEWNLPIKLGDLTHVLVTHGHIDHFGGCTFVAENSSARIGVHELDRLNLTDTESRIAQVSRRLETFLAEAGVEPERVAELVQLYGLTKLNYRTVAKSTSPTKPSRCAWGRSRCSMSPGIVPGRWSSAWMTSSSAGITSSPRSARTRPQNSSSPLPG